MLALRASTSTRVFARAYSVQAAAPVAAAPTPRPRTLGYLVARSEQGNLPVYTEYRNGRSNRLTVVRKISGDVGALRNDIAQYLADGHIDPLKAPPKVYIRPTSGHVEIKGHWAEEIKEWLAMRGF
ncbi:hypothetical protein CcaverHIS002_0703440 [Cutaneotrichosporon cavernicola]|uniref:Large ribosomal subunit protein mL49 n=1 Tax=Cutaneotrichosporon cavernicola TaxID=279322 RepID=A0AA48QYY7_9TREE|nr:uncharacterized protein CcaverHIS019_0703510 [Cutaneotrichosporon cavernicola]BEI86998.1 hypothetical protein CcaverHIS002_0703440 [Cutaneotrichosporon cavernicola]BEI94770.1 hypothetical protein CcaverHIS019_0703510 [Cutaneotrichosporon cavernicola]BEJ02545.1 hypothetical protein CcaverHIS631_0703400 [Cutaneotrichosporon cavernicola]BEJ10302.1 hypothetical protein CcaverHIS641_0703370 [Cutaneotrichosporon cavernicola]